MKNSSDTIGNRTRDLSTCSTVPQPTAQPRAPFMFGKLYILTATLHEDTHALVTHLDYNLMKPNKII